MDCTYKWQTICEWQLVSGKSRSVISVQYEFWVDPRWCFHSLRIEEAVLQSVCAGFCGPLCLSRGQEGEHGVSMVSRVLHISGVPLESSSINVTEWGWCGPSGFTRCTHHPLQVPAALLSAAGRPNCAAAGQDELPVKVHQQGARNVSLSSPPEEAEPQLGVPHLVRDVHLGWPHLGCQHLRWQPRSAEMFTRGTWSSPPSLPPVCCYKVQSALWAWISWNPEWVPWSYSCLVPGCYCGTILSSVGPPPCGLVRCCPIWALRWWCRQRTWMWSEWGCSLENREYRRGLRMHPCGFPLFRMRVNFLEISITFEYFFELNYCIHCQDVTR